MATKGNGSALNLPRQVEDTLSRLLPSEDVLDRPEFDAREFVNRNFPDEQSLDDIGGFVSHLRLRMKELDEALSQASQDQSLAAHQALSDLKEAKVAVQQLFYKIQDIRSKAEQSEVMVQEICRDIKQLDCAKQNLQSTLTALKRLHMLVNAVDQLEYMAAQRNYREAASLLEATNQLFTHFDNYAKVPKIVELHSTVRTLQEELARQIYADFRSIGPLMEMEQNFTDANDMKAVFSNLAAACAVIDALGAPARDKLIVLFCETELSSYQKEFKERGEYAGLQHAEKRYPWFYHLLSTIEPRMDQIFPKLWRMSQRLCISFCEVTRSHFLSQIGAHTPEEMDVTFLLKTLQRTLQFERDLAERFEGFVSTFGDELDEEGRLIDPQSAEGIRRRHRRKKREEERKALEAELQKRRLASSEGMQKNSSTSVEDDTRQLPSIRGLISGSFDPFMTAYVALERKNMEQMLEEAMSTEIVDRNGQLPVFSSSVNLFAYIRNSIKRCTALTNGQTFFDLQNEFKHCFAVYAQRLVNRVPTGSRRGSGNPSITSSSLLGQHHGHSSLSASKDSIAYNPSNVKLDEKQEEELCFVINTAEYCAETLPSLEDVIQQKIDVAFKESISLANEIDFFHDVGANAMKAIVSGLETLLDDDLHAISKMNWQNWEVVGDESAYVTHVGEVLRAYVPIIRQMLSSLYFTNFYDKFAASFVPKILESVMKCRKVNQVATQQLLLDVYALKTVFLQLPLINLDVSHSSNLPTIPVRYTKFITAEMGKIESVLKLIGTPNEMLVESFKIMWPDGNAHDFQKIMNMKGVKKADQLMYLETLGLQRKPSGKIAEMEGKMNDMTENWKKNMQNFAKVPFSFSGSSGSHAN